MNWKRMAVFCLAAGMLTGFQQHASKAQMPSLGLPWSTALMMKEDGGDVLLKTVKCNTKRNRPNFDLSIPDDVTSLRWHCDDKNAVFNLRVDVTLGFDYNVFSSLSDGETTKLPDPDRNLFIEVPGNKEKKRSFTVKIYGVKGTPKSPAKRPPGTAKQPPSRGGNVGDAGSTPNAERATVIFENKRWPKGVNVEIREGDKSRAEENRRVGAPFISYNDDYTFVVESGTDVFWRRDRDPDRQTNPPNWGDWNRDPVYKGDSKKVIDVR